MVILESLGMAVGVIIGVMALILVIALVIAVIVILALGMMVLGGAVAAPLAWLIERRRPGWGDRHEKAALFIPLALAAFLFVCCYMTSSGADITDAEQLTMAIFIFLMCFFVTFAFEFSFALDHWHKKRIQDECRREIESSTPKGWRTECSKFVEE